MTAPALHPDLAPLAMLLGEWAGEGRGRWGEGAPFAYREEIAFRHSGKPVLAYTQRTVALDDGRPMHSEMGFWRPAPEGAVEVTLAHPTGFTEIELGTVDGGIVRLATASVERTPTAKVVTRLERELRRRRRRPPLRGAHGHRRRDRPLAPGGDAPPPSGARRMSTAEEDRGPVAAGRDPRRAQPVPEGFPRHFPVRDDGRRSLRYHVVAGGARIGTRLLLGRRLHVEGLENLPPRKGR